MYLDWVKKKLSRGEDFFLKAIFIPVIALPITPEEMLKVTKLARQQSYNSESFLTIY